jgi:preprotein translocase subunit SecG
MMLFPYPLLAVSLMMTVVAVLFVLSGLALIFVVLLQRGRGGGLSGAFGGGGMAGGLLGTKTGDVLTWFTIGLVSVFLFLSVIMAKYYRPTVSEYGQASQAAQQAPARAQQPAQPQPTQPGAQMPATEEDTDEISETGLLDDEAMTEEDMAEQLPAGANMPAE